MSFDKLKGKMREKNISQEKLADHLGITVQALNAKLNGRSTFTLGGGSYNNGISSPGRSAGYFFSPKCPKYATR